MKGRLFRIRGSGSASSDAAPVATVAVQEPTMMASNGQERIERRSMLSRRLTSRFRSTFSTAIITTTTPSPTTPPPPGSSRVDDTTSRETPIVKEKNNGVVGGGGVDVDENHQQR
jgi:hypothetical protein